MSFSVGPTLAVTPNIFAVIVAYDPEERRFSQVLGTVAPQVGQIVIVDNANGAGLEDVEWSSALERIDMGGNAGIAGAQNAGLSYAFSHGATHVLLLDDDSLLTEGSVSLLFDAWREKSETGALVAAVGARYQTIRGRDGSPFARVKGLWRTRADLGEGPIVEASYLISSGSLISQEAFVAVGQMKDELFIDYVDIEWGLRARSKGWKSFGVVSAYMDHTIGDAPLTIFGKQFPFHSPVRHYYMFRNGASLILRSSLPAGWRIREVWALIRRATAYCLFAPSPRPHVIAIWRGLLDGVMGRMGPTSLRD